MTVPLSFSSLSSGSGSASEASDSAPLSGCPYVGFAFFGDGGEGPSPAERFLDTRLAALRTWRASLSSAKIVLRVSKEEFDIADGLRVLVWYFDACLRYHVLTC
jgi:hypothetical protein